MSALPEHLQFYPAAGYITERGEWFEAAPRPKGLRRRAAKACYRNASRLVLDGSAVFYVEGFAADPENFWCPHAWAADQDGRVIDPTWSAPENCSYFGVRFTAQQYAKAVGSRTPMVDSIFFDGLPPALAVAA